MKKKKERKKWPFDHGGLLNGKQLFDILLLKDRQSLKKVMIDERTEPSLEVLRKLYRGFMSDHILGLSEEEKNFLEVFDLEAERRAGSLESLVEFTDWEIRMGSLCGSPGYTGVEASADGKIFKKLDFLVPETKEERERIVRVMTLVRTGKELTLSDPQREDGDFMSCRTLKGEWGMKMGRRRKRADEEHML